MPRRTRRSLPNALLAACAAALIAALAPAGASASLISTTTTADVVVDDADCSLREAITAANANSNSHENACAPGQAGVIDSIMLEASTYPIASSGVDDANATGDFDLNPAGGSVEILGAGASSTIVDGADMDRVFHVLTNVPNYASFEDLTIRNGSTGGSGAGVVAHADLFMTDVAVEDNDAGLAGGGLSLSNSSFQQIAELENVTVSGNTASSPTAGGGGIFTQVATTVTGSTVSDNDSTGASGRGGGISAAHHLTVTAGTITGNSSANDGGGVYFHAGAAATAQVTGGEISHNTGRLGGGIYANGPVPVIDGVTLSGNVATDLGGAAATQSGLTVRNSLLTLNRAESTAPTLAGGAINANATGGGVTVLDSALIGNSVERTTAGGVQGGAIAVSSNPGSGGPALILKRSLVSANSVENSSSNSGAGGGISMTNSLVEATNTTFSGNTASTVGGGDGGGAFISGGTLRLSHSTFTGNSAQDQGDAIRSIVSGSANLRNSIIAEGADACSGNVNSSAGYNLDAGATCWNVATAGPGDQQNVAAADIGLGALASNGGPTQTHALLATSDAIDKVPAGACLEADGFLVNATDQRGAERPHPAGGNCDAGAYEVVLCDGQPITIFGSPDDDTLTGTAGNDVIAGFGGADTINAGDGADRVCGGAGSDTIRGGSGGDADRLHGEGDTDTVSYDDATSALTAASLAAGTTAGTDPGSDTLSGFENLTGTPFGDGSGGDPIEGDAGANTIDGGAGDDTIQGLGDDDSLIGGDGAGDTASWVDLTSDGVDASITDGVAGSVSHGTDTLSGFENLTGGTQADSLQGSGGPNTLNGFNGADTLDGLGGADFVVGGLPAAGPGDTATYGSLADGVTANLGPALGVLSASGQGTDTGNSIENLTGSTSNDGLSGDGGPNVLNGGPGDDQLIDDSAINLPANADTFAGGSDRDTVSYAIKGAGEPVTVDLGVGIDSGGEAGEKDFISADIEDALGGSGGDTFRGSEFANALTGGDGADTLDGRGGDDALDGGNGDDTATYQHQPGPIAASLFNSGSSGAQGNDTYAANSIENLRGSPDEDTLVGDFRQNALNGGLGDDELEGLGDDDTLTGGAGSNTASYTSAPSAVSVNLTTGSFTGGDGVDNGTDIDNVIGSVHGDELTGNANPNYIDGAAGADTIDGRANGDRLRGSGGIDTLSFGSLPGPVTANLATGQVGGAQGGDTVDAFEHLTGSADGDTLVGDAQPNVIDGAAGDDSIIPGAGEDDVFGAAGADDLFLRDSGGDDADCGAGDGAIDDIEADMPAGTEVLSNCDTDNVVVATPPVDPPPGGGSGTQDQQDGTAPACKPGFKLKKIKRRGKPAKRKCVRVKKKTKR